MATRAMLAHATEAGRQARALVQEIARLPKERRRHRPSPPATGLVLDVGAGHAPHPRADVVVDKYPLDDFERGRPMNLAKPLVVADGHSLPFADKTFAYVIAQHVLEHATDPVRFAAELSRVADAGFVQLPTRQAELVYGWPFHPWLVDLQDGELIFNPRGDTRAPAGQFMHDEFAESPLVRLVWTARRSRWHHSLEWRGQLGMRVEGTSIAPQTASFDRTAVIDTLNVAHVPALAPVVRAALRCPACRSPLIDSEAMVCLGCPRHYAVAGTVPLLLEEAASAAASIVTQGDVRR
jgi:SAM-dependent methyltransferase/uncharacterized protein YbaR (Trm112 family)